MSKGTVAVDYTKETAVDMGSKHIQKGEVRAVSK